MKIHCWGRFFNTTVPLLGLPTCSNEFQDPFRGHLLLFRMAVFLLLNCEDSFVDMNRLKVEH